IGRYRGRAGEEGQECYHPKVPNRTFGGTSGDRRRGVLSREIGRRRSRDRGYPDEHSQDALVLRAQAARAAAQGRRHREALAMHANNKEPQHDTMAALLTWHAACTL